ncbi:hypothetical protein SPFM14_00137 [Salmonella phage SPFM14]|nr:hypothetical protein SPFM14_00137 [Salmonella phage SPFM14]
MLIVELSSYRNPIDFNLREAVVVYNGRTITAERLAQILKTVTGDNWTIYSYPWRFDNFAEEFQRLGAALTVTPYEYPYFNIKVGQGAVGQQQVQLLPGDALLPANFEQIDRKTWRVDLIATPTSLGWIGLINQYYGLSLKPADVVNTGIQPLRVPARLDTVYRMHDVGATTVYYDRVDFADMFTDPDEANGHNAMVRIQALATANAIEVEDVVFGVPAIPTSDEDLAIATAEKIIIAEVNIENNLDLTTPVISSFTISRYKDFDMPLSIVTTPIISVWRLSS